MKGDEAKACDFPHTCPKCGNRAFIGFNKIDCSNYECGNWRGDPKRPCVPTRWGGDERPMDGAGEIYRSHRSARVRRVRINSRQILRAFASGIGQVLGEYVDMPEDARCVHARRSYDYFDGWELHVESFEFEPVPEMEEIPLWDPTIRHDNGESTPKEVRDARERLRRQEEGIPQERWEEERPEA